MHVVIVNAVFPPEPVISAKIGADLASYLRDIGHEVTVLCPYPTRPISAKYDKFSDRKKILISQLENGARVIRLPSFTSPKSTLLGRIYESWSFGYHVNRYLLKQVMDSDVVYANTWPFLSQWWLGKACEQLQKPLFFHIQDLYPESLLARLPRWLASAIAPILFWIERRISQMASGAIVISEGFREKYLTHRSLPENAVKTVINWIDDQPFETNWNRQTSCLQYDVPPNKFTFLFFGNIGPVAGVELLIAAFDKANIKNAYLVIAGDGSAKDQCITRAKKTGNRSIQFISDPDISAVPKIQSLADVCLLPVKKGQAVSSVPSKLMVYMVSGKPILTTVDEPSETASAIREAESGWIGPPENVNWLSDAMRNVACISTSELEAYGDRARSYALKRYSRNVGVANVVDFITKNSEN
ncbi:MAG: glycosyltransferase family 4 protein [Pirellulales bacterium]